MSIPHWLEIGFWTWGGAFVAADLAQSALKRAGLLWRETPQERALRRAAEAEEERALRSKQLWLMGKLEPRSSATTADPMAAEDGAAGGGVARSGAGARERRGVMIPSHARNRVRGDAHRRQASDRPGTWSRPWRCCR